MSHVIMKNSAIHLKESIDKFIREDQELTEDYNKRINAFGFNQDVVNSYLDLKTKHTTNFLVRLALDVFENNHDIPH